MPRGPVQRLPSPAGGVGCEGAVWEKEAGGGPRWSRLPAGHWGDLLSGASTQVDAAAGRQRTASRTAP